MSEECCTKCGNNTLKLCSVCGRSYAGLSKLHLRTSTHKLYKALFKYLKQAPEAEIQKLVDTYIPKAELPAKTISKQSEIATQTEVPKQKIVKKKIVKKKVDSDSSESIPKKKKLNKSK